jgi:CheY-like chemotaxis protein
MPGIGGFDVAKAIKEDPALSSMIVMMLTSDSRSGDVALSKKLHLNGYLIKPIKRADLLRVMIDSLDQAQTNIAVEPAKTSQPAVPTRVLNILAAEDAEDNRILLQSYLKNLPHRLTFAENGQAAVDTFKSQPFDLVFMDMHMPVMDGYQATQQIRQWEKEHPKERKTIIVALTADVIKDNLETAMKSGCDLYLTKPCKKSALLDVINQYAR